MERKREGGKGEKKEGRAEPPNVAARNPHRHFCMSLALFRFWHTDQL
jgi:hypothetical protein